jgi:4,4'-diaponeurosporenoate glycosyltransferase
LPDGWTGKAWACATGAGATTNELLVFLDADVVVVVGGLARVVGEREPEGLLSVQPFHVTKRPYERASAICNLVSMMGVGAFTPLRSAPRGAFGPCLVTSRAAYAAVGGHGAVASSVLDDIELARCYRAQGRAVRCLGGRGSVTFRMYPNGPRQLVDGWTKNMASGARRVGAVAPLLTAVWVALLAAVVVGVVTAHDLASVIAYGLVVAQVAWMLRRVGRFGIATALLFPLPLACFVFVFARSVLRTAVRGRVTWKGRVLNLRA